MIDTKYLKPFKSVVSAVHAFHYGTHGTMELYVKDNTVVGFTKIEWTDEFLEAIANEVTVYYDERNIDSHIK